jgi:DNA invertase Pin-like site-specific DNA recombinase
MKGQYVGYIRVSSVGQNTERQENQLTGFTLDKCFTEKVSAKDTNRPALMQMIDFVRGGDTVIVHSMDRFARNLDDLRRFVKQLTGKSVKVQFVKEDLKFTGDDSSMATLLLSVMGAFAEFERSLIRERQMEGIAIANAKGTFKGRKRSMTDEQISMIKLRVETGDKKAQIARDMGISRERYINTCETQISR